MLYDEGLNEPDLDHNETLPAAPSRSSSCAKRFTFTHLALCVSLLLNLVLIIHGLRDNWLSLTSRASDETIYCKFLPPRPRVSTRVIYKHFPVPPAPAQNVIRYVRKTSSHLLDTSIYTSPPSDEVDKAWDDLYQCKSSIYVLVGGNQGSKQAGAE